MAGARSRALCALAVLLIAACVTVALADSKPPPNENGYEGWLRYRPIEIADDRIAAALRSIHIAGTGSRIAAVRDELDFGLTALLGVAPKFDSDLSAFTAGVLVGTRTDLGRSLPDAVAAELDGLGPEGYIIATVAGDSGALSIVVAANAEAGLVYGTFRLLRELQLGTVITGLHAAESPALPLRMINHWDNLDRSVERVYGGFSIFDWPNLPEMQPRYRDYSRLMASIGINGIVVNNVNTYKEGRFFGWRIISDEFLDKAAALAGEFDRFGIKIFFSINFMSPILFGDLDTADPADPRVAEWWGNRARHIKNKIPNFGGFLVKADSEGELGPHAYDRTHADGANMLAQALAPLDGLVIWRAFVYQHPEESDANPDRAVQAYEQFAPRDGEFANNVILQIKHGPIDFQVNEPISTLFGAMPETNLMLELQITQEYTGNDLHLNFLAPFWHRVYAFDTYRDGAGSPLRKVLQPRDGATTNWGVAGVSNFHDGLNWTGHQLAQANAFAYGALTWDPQQSADEIARDWVKLTFGNDPVVVETVSQMLLRSYDVYSQYYFPYGLSLMGWAGGAALDGNGDRSRPDPYRNIGRYHQTDANGTGYDRTITSGSGYIGQYPPPLQAIYESPETCPPAMLLWFHYLPYTHKLASGKTLIQSIYDDHFEGVEAVKALRDDWTSLYGKIDEERYFHVLGKLNLQVSESILWRDVMNSFYFDMSGIEDDAGRVSILRRPYRGLRYGNGPRPR